MASGTASTAADTEEALVSKSTSVVWNYFGFKKDAAVLCKTRLPTVATWRGNTINLLQLIKKPP